MNNLREFLLLVITTVLTVISLIISFKSGVVSIIGIIVCSLIIKSIRMPLKDKVITVVLTAGLYLAYLLSGTEYHILSLVILVITYIVNRVLSRLLL